MRLHTWCIRLVLLVPLSAAIGCDGGDDGSDPCVTAVEKQLEVEPSDPALQFHLERCRLDVGACPQLCQLALSRLGITDPVESCVVGFVGERALLDVVYSVFNNEECFVGVPFSGGAR